MAYILGMDTGGTYTDGVLLDSATKEVISKAKALTTRENLITGITECINALDIVDPDSIDMVCLSTTLATNAVVEGKGCSAGLIEIGKKSACQMPAACSYYVSGRFSIQGRLETPLDTGGIRKAFEYMDDKVDAVVISGYASTRNPEHELTAKSIITELTDKPVVCAHEITGKLGYRNRTVTALLNASLIPIIEELIRDTKEVLRGKNITAPVMIVKGDGNFMTSISAEEKPIETILSGPAASIIGAKYLSGMDDCTVIDIGGTTSDIALLEDGCVRLEPAGANVGDWHTQVCAADIFTRGIGGDSRLSIAEKGDLLLGPEKTTPVSLYYNSGVPDVLEIRDDLPYGFTPTDLAHIDGIYDRWNAASAQKGLDAVAGITGTDKDETAQTIRNFFYSCIYDALVSSGKFNRCIPVVAIGAPAAAWMPRIASEYCFEAIVPKHAEVANAIGAAVGHIEEKSEILIRKDQISGEYMIFSRSSRLEAESLEEAKVIGFEEARKQVSDRMRVSGVSDYELLEDIEDISCEVSTGGKPVYIETRIAVVATGKPDGIR